MQKIRPSIPRFTGNTTGKGRKEKMALIETYVNISSYKDYDIAAYRLEKSEASEVIDALKKQIPKKPIGISVGEATSSGVCPTCSRDVVFFTSDDPVRRRNHCKYCGQKIDWNVV